MKLTNPKRIGKLTITGRAGVNKHGHKMWSYLCDCGAIGTATEASLIRPNKKAEKSCGCDDSHHVTHGHTNAPEYTVWEGMIQRCHNKNSTGFHEYGAMGIIVCREWRGRGGFERFISDMGKRPPGTTIDRVKNHEGYSRENCRWATPKQQARNRCTNRFINHNGETKTITDWATEAGFTSTGLKDRLDRGMEFGRAISEPKIR